MSRTLKLVLVAFAVVALMTFALASTAFTAGTKAGIGTGNTNGSPSDCNGSGLMHQYGVQEDNGASNGKPSDGTGPGDMHKWGQQSEQTTGGGQPSDDTGPGDMHKWGRA